MNHSVPRECPQESRALSSHRYRESPGCQQEDQPWRTDLHHLRQPLLGAGRNFPQCLYLRPLGQRTLLHRHHRDGLQDRHHDYAGYQVLRKYFPYEKFRRHKVSPSDGILLAFCHLCLYVLVSGMISGPWPMHVKVQKAHT